MPWSRDLGRTPPNFHGCLPVHAASYDSAYIEPQVRLDLSTRGGVWLNPQPTHFCAIFATFPNLVAQMSDLGSPKLIITHIFS